jgi:hypothetical protein
MKENFSGALRAEIEALVMRYEALVASRLEIVEAMGARQDDAAKAELLAVQNERDVLSREVGSLRAERDAANEKLEAAERRIAALEAEIRAGAAAASAFEEQFAQEKRFVEAAAQVGGTMLEGALELASGRKLEPGAAVYAALKAKGLEAVLLAAFKERGRSVAQAPLLEREKSLLPQLASIAGCELVAPAHGTRFSGSAMEKVATASDPAEEGNVVECLLPGLRRSGTEGSLVFPRVRVATG